MTANERADSRRRWMLAGVASLLLHLSLLVWWRGVDLAPGDGSAGSGGAGGGGGLGPGASVIEVSIDVDAPVPAGTVVPAEDVAVAATAIPVTTEPDSPVPTTERSDSLPIPLAAVTAGPTPAAGEESGPGSGSGSAQASGQGSGQGPGDGSGIGDGAGTGTGGGSGGVGARTGGTGSGTGGGTVPPRPIEITWPDTRKLSHCVGLRIDVRIRVDAQGRVERVEPVSAGQPDDCVKAALETARRIKFAPGTVAGKPTTLWSLVTIDFEKKK